MAINYTAILKLSKPDTATPNWATYMHRLADQVDGMFGKVVTVTKVTGATTLPDADGTADSGKALHIRSTQTLTGNVTVTVPARARIFYAENRTSGAFTWKVQTAGGNGVSVPQGKGMWLRSTTTGVIAASRTDGRSTATEQGVGIITATHIASDAVTTAKILDANVTLPKLAGAGSYGRILYTATSAGFPWATLARGTARQILSMSTSANTLPSWVTPAITRTALSTEITLAANTLITFTHGLTGLSNFYDYKDIVGIMVCKTTDLGYSVGDMIYQGSYGGDSANTGFSLIADSISAVKAMPSAQMLLMNKSTGSRAAITYARWTMRLRVTV